MTFAHEAIAALPVSPGLADAALIRAMCTRRFAYCLAASESATGFVALDPASGTVPLYLIQSSVMFRYDSTDSTTVHDGVTCLVSSDGKRFKSDSIGIPYSVLTKGTVAQPVSPSVGDNYLIPAAATGTDWSGKDNQIGLYTQSGWHFAAFPIGRLLYVKDETAQYHRNAAGVWTAGVGSLTLGTNAAPSTSITGAGAAFVRKIENQTTNTAPASPVAPVAYVVGTVPAGAWSAYSPGDLAICNVDGAWTRAIPQPGDEVFDKSVSTKYKWNGTAWVSVLTGYASVVITPNDAVASLTSTGSAVAGYVFSASTAPVKTANASVLTETLTASLQADYANQVFEIEYFASVSTPLSFNSGITTAAVIVDIVAAIYVDTETNARDWQKIYGIGQLTGSFVDVQLNSFVPAAIFKLSLADITAHTITIRFHARADSQSFGASMTVSLARRRIITRKLS